MYPFEFAIIWINHGSFELLRMAWVSFQAQALKMYFKHRL